MAVWSQVDQGVRVRVRVRPRASRNRVVGVHGDALKVQVMAPPVEGAANEAVVDVVAKWAGVPRRMVTIIHGDTGRDKVLEIRSDAPAALAEQLRAAVAAFVDKPSECA